MLLATYIILQAQTAHNDSAHHQSAVIISSDHNAARNNSYEIMKAMYEANGIHFQDPRAPRFLFLDRKGRVALGIGGYVKGTMSVDMAGIADNTDLLPPPFRLRHSPICATNFAWTHLHRAFSSNLWVATLL